MKSDAEPLIDTQISEVKMNLERDVLAIATESGRAIGTGGHDRARDYLIDRFTEISVEPYLPSGFNASYEYDGQEYCNLLAITHGSNRSLSPILVGAHYDTCGVFPGADDNAAAVSIVLEAAAQIADRPLERSVIFALFDAEEPPAFLSPAMGSIRFFNDQKNDDLHCALIMDLVGHDVQVSGLEDLLFISGVESNDDLGSVIQNCPSDKSIRVLPTLNRYIGDMSDHYIFRENQVPYLFLSSGVWPHYHRGSDTPEKLNYRKMEGITRYILSLIRGISDQDMSGEFEGYDSTCIELKYIEEVLTPVLSQHGMALNAKSRGDIDDLASMMMSYLGV